VSIVSLQDLIETVRNTLRRRHLSYNTGKWYLEFIRDFVRFHKRRSPVKMGVPEIRDYRAYLAVERNVAASTQNVAFNALLFVYRETLEIALPTIEGVERARRTQRLSVPIPTSRSSSTPFDPRPCWGGSF